MTIKVTNLKTKAFYIHRNVNYYDIGWIKANPNLSIEVLKHKR